MKYIKNILLLTVLAGVLLTSCEFDNFDEPNATLSGKLKYGDRTLDTRYGTVFKLYQYKEDGYIAAGSKSIDVYINQEGEFNAKLFPGRYKMVVYSEGGINYIHDWNDFPRNGNNELDTLYFDLNKNKTIDFNVTPFFEINDFDAFYRNDSIVSRFTIKKLTDRDDNQMLFRRVALYVSPTVHVNYETPLSEAKSGAKVDTPIEIKVPLKSYYNSSSIGYLNNYRSYAYVRVGISLRLTGQEFIYSKVIKVTGIPEETIKKFK